METICKVYDKIDKTQRLIKGAVCICVISGWIANIICLVCNIDAFKFNIPMITLLTPFALMLVDCLLDFISFRLFLKKQKLSEKEIVVN